MTNAALVSPMHPGEHLERFADVSKNDHHKASCADHLHERATLLRLENQIAAPPNSMHAGTNATSALTKVTFTGIPQIEIRSTSSSGDPIVAPLILAILGRS